MVFLWFPLFSFGFVWFPREKQRKRKSKEKQTNQGKFKEAISSQNASIMPVTKEAARFSVSCYVFGFLYLERQDARDLAIVL